MLSMYVKGRVVDGRYNVVWRRREGEREEEEDVKQDD